MNDYSKPQPVPSEQSGQSLWMLPKSLEPGRLIAEIGLLIDYISGRGTRSFISMPPPDPNGELFKKFSFHPVAQFLSLCQSGRSPDAPGGDASPCEKLVLTRDWLNSVAAPVTGDTIAFSILVGRIRHPDESDDARVAFPHYVDEAERINRLYVRTRMATIALTALVLATSAWAMFGTLALGSLADLRTRSELLEQEQGSKEATINATRLAKTAVERQAAGSAGAALAGHDVQPSDVARAVGPSYIRYCPYDEKTAPPVDADQPRFCGHKLDLAARRDAAYQTLNFWFLLGLPKVGLLAVDRMPDKPPAPASPIDGMDGHIEAAVSPRAVREAAVTITDDAARTLLAVVVGCLLPLFMAMLGSNVAVLRDFSDKVRERLLTPKDRRLYQIRIALGVVAGVAVGFFLAPAAPGLSVASVAGSASAGALASAAALASTSSLSAPALGFIAGFAVDLFFQFLENAARGMFQQKT